MKRLLIDVNSIVPYYLSGKVSGIGRTTLELLQALAKMKNLPFELVLFTQNTKGIKTDGRLPFDNVHFYMPNRTLFKYCVNRLHLKQLATHYDLLHIPHNTDICETMSKTIFTIHDLIVYRYPEYWNVTEKDKAYFRKVAKQSKAIITCSESSKQDILHFWNMVEDKVVAIPWGINTELFHPIKEQQFCEKNGIGNLFYFSASCNHPRKNTPLMLDAFAKYIAKGGRAQMVLLNPKTKDTEKYQYLIDQRKLIVLKDVSDADLVELYSQAHCTIVASSFEGFGLPVLESLSCGTQVLCANNSSLSEIGENVVDYFQELNEECICEKMLKYDSINKANTLESNLCQKHLRGYSWERCAEKYVETYEKLLYNP